jgi:hypothetical protein
MQNLIKYYKSISMLEFVYCIAGIALLIVYPTICLIYTFGGIE